VEQLTAIIHLLADGAYHSGEEIGQHLGITRSGVWKALKQFEQYGIDIESTHGKGYRVPDGLELLVADNITVLLTPPAKQQLSQLEILTELASTNSYLLAKAREGLHSGHVVTVEWQTAGRGRRGRPWVSPFGSNIYTSILWQFPGGARELSGLSIAVGVAIVRALEAYGIHQLQLKWPNDILWHNKKLAGVLVETFIDDLGVCHSIIGIGLNINLPKSAAGSIDQPWIDIKGIINHRPGRNRLLGLLLNELLLALPEFERTGLSAFLPEWQALDMLYGQEVTVEIMGKQETGIAQGIDNQGGLILKTNDQHKTLNAGEVTVRPK